MKSIRVLLITGLALLVALETTDVLLSKIGGYIRWSSDTLARNESEKLLQRNIPSHAKDITLLQYKLVNEHAIVQFRLDREIANEWIVLNAKTIHAPTTYETVTFEAVPGGTETTIKISLTK